MEPAKGSVGLKWYWKVRLYNTKGQYGHACVVTERVLGDIDLIQDFYKELTGCKMLLEGMSEAPFSCSYPEVVFNLLWAPQ